MATKKFMNGISITFIQKRNEFPLFLNNQLFKIIIYFNKNKMK